jgi:hypothetical protein
MKPQLRHCMLKGHSQSNDTKHLLVAQITHALGFHVLDRKTGNLSGD